MREKDAKKGLKRERRRERRLKREREREREEGCKQFHSLVSKIFFKHTIEDIF
jgi:hypothetical protein